MPPKPSPTHFLCIPLVTRASRPQLTQSLASFRAEVSERGSPVGGLGALPGSLNVVPEEAIRPVGSLHLTLGVFSFPRKPKSETAKALLQSLRPREILKAYKPPPAMPGSTVIPGSVSEESSEEEELKITLRGLRSMQSTTPQKSAVLYAPPVDPRGRLQQFCEGVRKVFQDAGLMVSEDRPLLLHATVVNTIYVKGRKTQGQGQSRGTGRGRGRGGGRHNHRERLTIDATGILDRFEDHVWMEDVKVEKIAICKMGARKVEVDGVVVDEEYEVVGEVDV
ncbi:Protein kinase A anchor protein, nuclear localization signal domain containing protein [Naviculisporaceae sp. PSN 640]